LEELTMPISMADAVWNGTLRDGEGTMSAETGAFSELPFSFATRFGDEEGTNPEELIGAAHAGCFSMALSNELDQAGYTPEEVATNAEVHLEDGAIERVHLTTRASVPDVEEADFQAVAEEAKENCPVSVALGAVDEITLDATLDA
jgi:osmotically inducible protein OsmC